MYFEPTKRNYYRFPSFTSVQDYDAKYYYPDHPYSNSEGNRYDAEQWIGLNNENQINDR